ncbi:MAG: hypothetical protein K6B41_13980 [Butyrivibrio sp.]|nr:hypothetical protein [Butyrivibrio sp.]
MILYTSDEKIKRLKDSLFGQILFTIFCTIFGLIYEKFSHEVYSFYMIYAFAIPLVLAILPYIVIIRRSDRMRIPGEITISIWNMAVATLTVGSLFKGVIEIYGTTNKLTAVYPIAGGVLAVAAVFTYFFHKERTEEETSQTA